MKTLLIVRHAKSSWSDPFLGDHDRPLNERGLRDAPFMGDVLAQRGPRPDLLVSSSAVRALHTARFFAQALGHGPEQIAVMPSLYHAEIEDILELLRTFDDAAATVALFAHNPTLTALANSFEGPFLENLPTCGIVAVGFDVAHWTEAAPSNGKVLFYEFPKNYFPKDSLD